MRCLSFVLLLAVSAVTIIVSTLAAQEPTPESLARRRFNQVFVKVIVPVTVHTPKQEGAVVESWVAQQLKQQGESEYFALTDWVPVCDGLLSDEEVDNRVWPGRHKLKAQAPFCPVGGDIPERKNGHVLVSVSGWAPVAGYEAKLTLADETGTRAVEPVRVYSANGEKLEIAGTKPMAYVAVLIGPPPQEGRTELPSKQK